ncbi:hypothetical protein [Priestia megaterium]|uniref:Uncharacterized protein n=1 Tax=Priestia megaterium TaxID=1404 RepID=A0A6M6E5Q0_PRIMG|nr:hypothetical protein [Priestia megaterium]QJX80459.1 hypothetical protein FDZ14_30695 [Priestia megaterium]
MDQNVKVKDTAKKFRMTLLVLFVAYTALHYFVFHFSYEVYSAVVGTLIVGGLAVEIFYKKLLEEKKNENLSKQLKITLLVIFALFIVLQYTVFHFSYDVISAVVGTMIIAGVTLEMFYKKLFETLKNNNSNNHI